MINMNTFPKKVLLFILSNVHAYYTINHILMCHFTGNICICHAHIHIKFLQFQLFTCPSCENQTPIIMAIKKVLLWLSHQKSDAVASLYFYMGALKVYAAKMIAHGTHKIVSYGNNILSEENILLLTFDLSLTWNIIFRLSGCVI